MRCVVLSAVLAALLVAIVPAAFARSATSEHQLVFSGAEWGGVLKKKGDDVRLLLLEDIGGQLVRRQAFNTTITISSLNATGTMSARVTVAQTLLGTAPHPDLQHIWPPDEVNSLITQSAFTGTLGLYEGSDTAHFLYAQLPGSGINISGCTLPCKGMIFVSGIVVAAMVLIFILVLSCICCSRRNKTCQS